MTVPTKTDESITQSPEPIFAPTIEQRKVIYQARRGLKELDMFIDPYVKGYYLTAEADEQITFAKLLTYEDPDLLDYFMNQATPEDDKVAELIVKLKTLKNQQG